MAEYIAEVQSDLDERLNKDPTWSEKAIRFMGTTAAVIRSNKVAMFLWRCVATVIFWLHKLALWSLSILVGIIVVYALALSAVEIGTAVWEFLKNTQIVDGLLGVGSEQSSEPMDSTPYFRYIVVALGSYVAAYAFMQLQFKRAFGAWFRPSQDSRQLNVKRLSRMQQSLIAVEELEDFAEKYAKAWSSQDAASVAAFFSPNGSLKDSDSPRATGHAAITEAVQECMTLFPNARLMMDKLEQRGDRAATLHWTLVGTNTGPGAAGKSLRIRGHENWTIGEDGLIAKSRRRYDKNEHQRQIESDVD